MIKIPRRDGTGPYGEGANTGRGRGPCTTKKKAIKRGNKNDKRTTK